MAGQLWLWGNNGYGNLGDNTNINKSSPVQTVTFATNWSSLFTGFYHVGAIKTDGTLWLWGRNLNGKLGDNTTINKSSPVQTIAGGINWSKVACGPYNTAAIKTDGTLWIWGRNNGTLGDNTITDRSSPVQTVTGGTNWSVVACGAYHAAAIKTDGTLWTWGINSHGQLGDNTLTNKSSPIQTITGGNNWSSVACGYNFVAAIKTDGTLWLWGQNTVLVAAGQLGDNTGTNKSSPVQTITGGNNWSSVACGRSHTAALKRDGTLWTWGLNSYGNLGDNTSIRKSSPIQTISAGNNWSFVACGYQHTTATKTDGSLWAWGRNNDGQLGDNTLANKSSPIQTVMVGNRWFTVGGGYSTAAIYENTASALSITTQPANAYNAQKILNQPVVAVVDSSGAIVTTSQAVITATIASGTPSLTGTTNILVSGGVAQFTDLTLSGLGSGSLIFTASGLTSAISSYVAVEQSSIAIVPKRTETSGRIPYAEQLRNGELAINLADKKGYVKNSSGSIVNVFTGLGADVITSGMIGENAVNMRDIAPGAVGPSELASGVIGGTNTQILYNSSGGIAGTAAFTLSTTSGVVTIAPQNAGYNALTLRSFTSQTADLLKVQNSAGTDVARITSSGEWVGPLGSGNIVSGYIASGQIGINHLASGVISTAVLGSGQVASGSIASGSVGQFKLSSGAVNSGHIGNNAVVSGSIASGSIGNFHLASGAVTSGEIGNAAVVSGSIASGSVGTFHIASGSITSDLIASGAIINADVADNAVTSGKIASGSIGTLHISSGGVQNVNIASGAVLSGNIASGQIGINHLASGAASAAAVAGISGQIQFNAGGLLGASSAITFSSGTAHLNVTAQSTNIVPIRVSVNSGHTANSFEVYNSGTLQSYIRANGGFFFQTNGTYEHSKSVVSMDASFTDTVLIRGVSNTNGAGTNSVVIRGYGAGSAGNVERADSRALLVGLRSGDAFSVQGTGRVAIGASYATNSPAGTTDYRGILIVENSIGIKQTFPSGSLHVSTGSAGIIGVIVQGFTSQTANLQEWQNSAGTALAYVSSAGDAYFNNVRVGTGPAGTGNTVLGYTAGNSNTGNYNTFIGWEALYNKASGGNNVAVGADAGYFQADGSTALTATSNSIYIGTLCRGFNNSDSNSIVIGYQAIGQGANTTVIGTSSTVSGTIYGNINFPFGIRIGTGGFGISSGGIFSGTLAPGTVTSGSIASGQIGNFHLASGAVTSGDIGNAAVVSGSVASGSIGTFHIASGSITSELIASGAVINADVADNAVTSGKIASGSIGTMHISSGGVQNVNIASGAVTSGNIASGSIGSFHIASGAVTSGEIGNASVVSGSIASGTIGLFHFASGQVAAGGANSQVQYNSSGALAGAAAMSYSTTSPHVTIQAQNAAYTPLVVKGTTSQTADLLQLQTSTGYTPFAFNVSGQATMTMTNSLGVPISMRLLDDTYGTISWEGSLGQLFSISNNMTGIIFSVNDISGIPSIDVNSDGTVRLAQYAGNVGIRKATPSGLLDVGGDAIINGLTVGLGNGVSTNTTLGYQAQYTGMSGQACNTAIGYRALYTASGSVLSQQIVAIGYGAVSSGGSIYNATVVGTNAGTSMNSPYNTAIGMESMGTGTGGNGYNTAVGHRSMYATAGSSRENIAVGYESLRLNTGGSYNVALGVNAAYTATTAGNVVAVGYQALYNNTASGNVAIGFEAAAANTTGTRNTAIGFRALRSGGTGSSDNTAVGHLALSSNINGNQNTAVGSLALSANTSGWLNVANGYAALQNNTTGIRNTAVGRGTLNTQQTASDNTAVGYNSMFYNTTGERNVGLGYSALFNNSTGSYNIAIGYETLLNTTTGSNTAVGYQASRAMTAGLENSSFGTTALFSNISGSYNCAFGNNSLYSNTASENTGLGHYALNANTTGAQNTAVGNYAGRYFTTGSYNTVLGSYALYGSFGSSTGSHNTAIGYYSLRSATTGANNVAVGNSSLYTNTAGGNSTAIGYQALYNNTASGNVAVGTNALFANTTGQGNAAVGFNSLTANVSGNFNTAVGFESFKTVANGYGNTGLGYQAGATTVGAGRNSFIGYRAGYLTTSGNTNQAFGWQTLYNNTLGSANTALGAEALGANTVGNSNVAIGNVAGYYQADGATALQSGNNSIYIGNSCRGFNNADSNSIVIGYQAIGQGANTTVIGTSSTVSGTIYGNINFPIGIRVNTGSSTQKGIVVQGAASQTANLTEWQNNTGTNLAYMDASGNFYAVSKSFYIDHPTKPGKKLRHVCVEAPSADVYFRGKSNSNMIDLPDYWSGLVGFDTITVMLTPVGKKQDLYFEKIENNKVYVGGDENPVFNFVIFGERKDIPKVVIED